MKRSPGYKIGDRVKIIRGSLAGTVFTITAVHGIVGSRKYSGVTASNVDMVYIKESHITGA